MARTTLYIIAALLAGGCAQDRQDDAPPYDVDFEIPRGEDFPSSLSAYALFQAPLSALRPADGVLLYELSSELFTDYAHKQRLMKLPAGGSITLDGDRLSYPEGTVLAKTFSYRADARDPEAGRRIIETRLLVKTGGRWNVATYLWNAEQTDATLLLGGTTTDVSWIDAGGQTRGTEYAPLPSSRFLLATTDPAALPDGLEDTARALPAGVHEPRGRAQRWQLHIRTLPDGARLYGCVDENALEASEGHESTARTVRWIASIVVALLGLALGFFTTRRIIAPLRRMTEAVSAHDPAGPPPDLKALVSDDELGVLAEQLEIAMARVAASARQEQLFGRYASHELRSSLAVASGVAELLEDREDSRLQRPLARLRRATEDMEGIVETCLWLARSHRQMPPSEPVDLRGLAEEALAPLRRRASPDVALDLDVEPGAILDAPPRALRMIVDNLLTNAVRHTASGRIVLRADAAGVEVRDTGPGIPPTSWPASPSRSCAGRAKGTGWDCPSSTASASGWAGGSWWRAWWAKARRPGCGCMRPARGRTRPRPARLPDRRALRRGRPMRWPFWSSKRP